MPSEAKAQKPNPNKPLTYDHLRSRKKPITKKVLVPLDSEIAEEYTDAKQEFERQKGLYEYKPADYHDSYREAELKLQAARELVEKNSVEFVFRSLGRRKFEDLMVEHPPTDKQRRVTKERGWDPPEFNKDTFPPALVFACLQSPEMTYEEVIEIFESDDWSGAETTALFLSCMDACSNRREVDLGKG